MSKLSDQLHQIANALGFHYIKSADLNESNMLVHYRELLDNTLLLDVGFSTIDVAFTNNPTGIQNYQMEYYLLKKKTTTDMLAEDIDDILTGIHSGVQEIRNRMDVVSHNLPYKMEYITFFDDMLIGYKLTGVVDFNNGC